MPSRDTNKNVDPDRLRMLAKKASDIHLGGAVPMTEAVIQSVRDESGLGPEHVRRVITFANNETFQRMFQKEAGDHRVINFQLADPSDVLKELNMGATPSPVAVSDRSPNLASYVPGADSVGDMFEPTKTAAADMPNPMNELWRMRQRVDGLLSHAQSEYVSASARYDDSVCGLCKSARNVVLEGGSTADINRALSFYSDSTDMTKLALSLIQVSLGKEALHTQESILSKTAAAVPNPQHPLVESFKEFSKVAMDRFRYAAVIDSLQEQLKKVNGAVKRHMG